MPLDPNKSSAIYASDLLSTGGNADKLDGLDAIQFLRTDVNSGPVNDDTIILGGPSNRFNNIWTASINGQDSELYMRRNKSNNPTKDLEFDLGSAAFRWKTIYTNKIVAPNITTGAILTPDGTKFSHFDLADIGTNTHVDIDNHIAQTTTPHGATSDNVGNRLVARDAQGSFRANIMYGLSTNANYADLAEKYTTSEKASVGTVYCVSDNEEYDVEICNVPYCDRVVGVVSEKPGFIMNDGIDGVLIGLKGKVSVRVIGPVKKGDILVSAGLGRARADNDSFKHKLGIANETNLSEEEKLIQAIL